MFSILHVNLVLERFLRRHGGGCYLFIGPGVVR